MIILSLQCLGVYILLWLFWRFNRILRARSSLDNIPGPASRSLWTGVLGPISSPNAWDYHKEIAEKYGSVIKIKAILGENQLYVYDPKALHQIFIKDQHIFEETDGFIHINLLVHGPGLGGTLGDRHRKQRKMMNPVFSTSNLRDMIPVFYGVMNRLRDTFRELIKDGPVEIDLLDWMSRASLELIGQGGLGYSFDPLTTDAARHPFVPALKGIGPAGFKVFNLSRYILSTVVKIGTPKMRRAVVDWIPWRALHDIRDISDVLHKGCLDIYESKKKALSEGDESAARQIGQGKDVLSILMRANMKASDTDQLPDDELLGQISTFIFASTDTTSGALSRLFHLLSTHQDVQDTLRQEVVEARDAHGRDLTYDELTSLPYLDAVIRETLRLYPPVTRVSRTTRQDVALSLSNTIKGIDGREMGEIAVPANTTVIVGIMACNRNPEIWGPDSLEWKPERWLKPLPDSVSSARIPGVYSNLMTFIGGNRSCIGFKFSELEMKIVLSLLIESFRFSPSDKEIFWRMGGIAQPTVHNAFNPNFQLPVIVQSMY